MIRPDSIESEKGYKNYLEKNMEREGWKVEREVKPDGSEVRADIIAKHRDIGRIGIECKYMTGGSTVIAEAFRQLENNYAGKTFGGQKIDAWGVGIYGRYFSYHSPDVDDYDQEKWYHSAMGGRTARIGQAKRVINGLGVGWVTSHSNRVFLEFCPSGKEYYIPLFGLDENLTRKYADATDFTAIREKIAQDSPDVSSDRGAQQTPLGQYIGDGG